jgi:hypothetical protein
MPEGGTFAPTLCMASLNSSRSSALRITSAVAPIISTPYFSRMPASCSAMAMLSAVWPPSVGSTTSGRSAAMTFSSTSIVMGSMYVRSAKAGSVMIVAGLLLTRMTL